MLINANSINAKFGSRFAVIDVLRGFSAIVVIYIHFMMAWVDDIEFVELNWAIIDFLAAPNFVLLSCIGKMISLNAQKNNGKILTPQTVTRSSFLLIIGSFIWIFECVQSGRVVLPCNLLFFMGVLQIMTPILVKTSVLLRLLLVILLFTAFIPLSEIEVIRLIFLDTRLMNPYFSWLILPLLTSIVFHRFTKPDSNKKHELKKICLAGMLMVFFALVMSAVMKPTIISSLPAFLMRSYPHYILFTMGIDMLIFALVFMFESRINNHFTVIRNSGRLSLTCYIISGLGFLFPIKLTILSFHLIFPFVAIIVVIILSIITIKFNDALTVEWMLQLYSKQLIVAMTRAGIRRMRVIT